MMGSEAASSLPDGGKLPTNHRTLNFETLHVFQKSGYDHLIQTLIYVQTYVKSCNV